MKIKAIGIVIVSCLFATAVFAGNGYVTLKKPGTPEKKIIVSNVKFVCNNQESESFVIELDGAIADIPFAAIKMIKLIRYEKPRSSYQLFFKDSSKDRPLVPVQPACDRVNFVGTNSFGGTLIVDTQFMQSVEFK